MKPWRTVAKPHADVLTGTLKQSEFAADLSRVAEGSASKEYQDAVQFFDRTYITEGMKELLLRLRFIREDLGLIPRVKARDIRSE